MPTALRQVSIPSLSDHTEQPPTSPELNGGRHAVVRQLCNASTSPTGQVTCSLPVLQVKWSRQDLCRYCDSELLTWWYKCMVLFPVSGASGGCGAYRFPPDGSHDGMSVMYYTRRQCCFGGSLSIRVSMVEYSVPTLRYYHISAVQRVAVYKPHIGAKLARPNDRREAFLYEQRHSGYRFTLSVDNMCLAFPCHFELPGTISRPQGVRAQSSTLRGIS
jgi:hypothetical protein